MGNRFNMYPKEVIISPAVAKILYGDCTGAKSMSTPVPLYAKPKAILASTSSILNKLTPQELFDLSQSEHLDYPTLMILAGHIRKTNGTTKLG